MSKHYTIREFFRQMPAELLGRYFESRSVSHGLDVASLPQAKPEPWIEVWEALSDVQRPELEADFRDIFGMATEKGALAIVDELRWHLKADPEAMQAAVDRLANLGNHYERAMVAFLDYPTCWRGATRLHHADTLTSWRKRKNLPHQAAAVDEVSIQRFSALIGNYFNHTEGRGRHCMVEAYRRGERDYFFAYPEDHSQRSIEWVDGQFHPRPHNPAFEVVFVYTQAEGSLDIHFKGVKKVAEAMQSIFAQAILKLEELPPDPKDERVYDLAPLAQRDFDFQYAARSGVARVAVRKIRLSSIANKGDRITLEADSEQNRHAVHELLETVRKALPLHLYNVTQVELAATVTVNPDRPPKKVTIRITHPNSCSLKYDELDLKLRDMLAASRIEPLEPQEAATGAENGAAPT